MTAIFIAALGYPLGRAPRFCRLLTIGTERHVTACRASIDVDEPVLLTAHLPVELCSACREDMRIRSGRGEDLTPWRGEIGVRAELTVERAAEEMFGPAVARTVTPDLRPVCKVDPAAAWDDERGGTVIARIEELEDACR